MAASLRRPGRSCVGAIFCLAAILVLSAQQVTATQFVVGGSAGWTIGCDYAAWAALQQIYINDTLLFNMPNRGHTIVQLFTAESFAKCNFSASYRLWANFTEYSFEARLTEPGYYFFTCYLPSHCPDGQKLSIYVRDHKNLSPQPGPGPAYSPYYSPPPSYSPFMAPFAGPELSPTPPPVSVPVYAPIGSPSLAPASPSAGSPLTAPTNPTASPSAASTSGPTPGTNGAASGSVPSIVAILLMSIAALLML